VAIEPILAGLNPRQLEVVLARDHCTAYAGPGTGKTKTISAKVAYLLSSPNVRVGAVSFTRDSATTLKQRILEITGNGVKKRLLASTINSLCFRQIGKAERDIASEGFRFIIARKICEELSLGVKADEVIRTVDMIKVKGELAHATDEMLAIYAMYQTQMERSRKIDFQDMIKLAVEGMTAGTLSPYRLDHLLVDEYQDVDWLQYQWIRLHAKNGTNVTVVGDDDQAIYAFRHAMGFEGMKRFSSEFQAEEIVLGENYRSHTEILARADSVIRNNIDRVPKTLIAKRGGGAAIFARLYDDPYDEAFDAVTVLAKALGQGKTVSILARNNRDLDAAESSAQALGVKYHRASGSSILKQPEGAILCDLLELIQGTKTNGMDQVLSYARVSEGERQLLFSKYEGRFPALAPKVLADMGFSSTASQTYRDLVKNIDRWKTLVERKFYDLVLDGVVEWMVPFANKGSAVNGLESVRHVLSCLKGTFAERISYLNSPNESKSPDPDALILSTIHSAKGLEWDCVWVVRSEEGIIPPEASSISEERRLYYVAITRARDWLMMSSTKKNPVSRFLMETGVKQEARGEETTIEV